MSNPIPPFVCNTPPPIDCIADAPPPLVEDDFGDFAVVDDHQFEVSSLPVTPVHVAKLPDITTNTSDKKNIKTTSPPPLPDSVYDFPPEDKITTSTTIETNSFTKENTIPLSNPLANISDTKNELDFIIEAHSPPPFEYAVEDDVELPPCVAIDDDDVDIDDEPDEFVVDDEMAKYDDNISLPSLKFDSLSNHSKSTTPVSAEELPKPSPKLEEDCVVVSEVVENGSTDVQVELELNEVPIESLNIRDEQEEPSLRQSSEEQEDDFAEFEAFPAPSNEKTVEEPTTEPAFEADFSQFSSFVTETVPPPVTTSQLAEKSALDDLDADDFDDFQDFTVPPAATTLEQRKASVNSTSSEPTQPEEASETTTKHSDEEENAEDDDFGEFSEVVETNPSVNSIPSSNSGFNLANLNEKLKPILEMMFPSANKTNNNNDDKQEEYTPSAQNDLNQLTAIKQIDTAKALDHQWINSEVRHSLIKSLGVDSRNILYGEKWNSSMPRFAANLSFNPLEPMKSSDKSSTSKNNNGNSATINTNDYRKRGDDSSSSSFSKTDVPAVEFDWNSSGLVNPLDGVKEILHEGTLETFHPTESGQSNSSSDQQSSSTFKSNTTTTTIATSINDNIKTNNNNNNIYDSDKSLRCFIDDIEEAIPTSSEFKSNADAPIAIPTATTTATNIITDTIPSAATSITLPGDYTHITGNEFQSSGVLETNLDSFETTTPTTSQVLNHNTITHAAKYQEILKTDHLETESSQSHHSGVVSTSTYAGPLKETHIYTPSKATESVHSSKSSSGRLPMKAQRTSSSESKCPIDFDYEIAAAGIIIDETVVKKEYRDVEYNPGFGSKYREGTIEHNHHRLSPDMGLSKHISYNNDFVQSKEIPRNPLDDDTTVSAVVEKTKPSVPNSNSFDDEFSDFQSVPPPAPALSTVVPSTTIIPSTSSSSSTVINEPKTSPSHWRVLKETAEISSLSSRTGTPVSLSDEMILCPAILIPQAIQMENKENKPKIEWPEPGINPEELARIEELFPQPKTNNSNKPSPSHSIGGRVLQQNASNRATPQLSATAANDDDDWSDFVSVPAAAPNNHIQSISQQFQKTKASPVKSNAPNDSYDDEWSDFVSGAPPPAPTTANMRPSAYPQFNSASWQNANFYNNPMSAYASPPTSFYYQPQPSAAQAPQQNLSNNRVPNLTNLNNNTVAPANTNNNVYKVNNNSINQYLINNQAANHLNHHHQQHIQMMRDFSSASPMDGGPLTSSSSSSSSAGPGYGYGNNRGLHSQFQQLHHQQLQQHGKSSQFGVSGSSKIAPSISLIPDLGFVAPAHTSFISVPKNSFAAAAAATATTKK